LIAYTKLNPLKVTAFAINAVSVVLTLMVGKRSGLTGGAYYSGFDFGDSDGGGD
jgi:hypothetical protein